MVRQTSGGDRRDFLGSGRSLSRNVLPFGYCALASHAAGRCQVQCTSAWFRNLPIGVHLGDFMQLRPAGRRSLCEWIQDASESDRRCDTWRKYSCRARAIHFSSQHHSRSQFFRDRSFLKLLSRTRFVVFVETFAPCHSYA